MKVYIFRKAALAALRKIHTFMVDILIIKGMIRRTVNLKNTSAGELLLTLFVLVIVTSRVALCIYLIQIVPGTLLSF